MTDTTHENEELRNIRAQVAYGFAATPVQAEYLSGKFGPNRVLYDEARVRQEFGDDAARAWRNVVHARSAFFSAIRGDDQ